MFARIEWPRDGSVWSHMLHRGMPAGRTRDRELVMPTVLVTFLGGMQEPGHGAANTLVTPEQMQYVRADLHGRLRAAVAEGVRWIAPIGAQVRAAVNDIRFGGVTITTGLEGHRRPSV